jgi:hypothetical protein
MIAPELIEAVVLEYKLEAAKLERARQAKDALREVASPRGDLEREPGRRSLRQLLARRFRMASVS